MSQLCPRFYHKYILVVALYVLREHSCWFVLLYEFLSNISALFVNEQNISIKNTRNSICELYY